MRRAAVHHKRKTTDLAFSGTQDGMTYRQQVSTRKVVLALNAKKMLRAVRHGDCIGSDFQFDDIFRSTDPIRAAQLENVVLHIHPPIKEEKRAFTTELKRPRGRVVVHEAKDYLPRNDDMVYKASALIATPKSRKEERRGSGTWYTIRRAREKGMPACLVMPDGSLEYERGFIMLMDPAFWPSI